MSGRSLICNEHSLPAWLLFMCSVSVTVLCVSFPCESCRPVCTRPHSRAERVVGIGFQPGLDPAKVCYAKIIGMVIVLLFISVCKFYSVFIFFQHFFFTEASWSCIYLMILKRFETLQPLLAIQSLV